ncbi:hypothetical protein PHLGIDRAFT_28072 [Phlebiopsis gigantea 11061_1 CR5-6]|uniref:Beta-lactamase-related domain-containing protein n=1 Tax=Phlebiopsis gigantea (strain 11061_1 CR5-6) TaxID=745531 RepID=A0A0C3SCR4_PHLG1|nr:hypothetical protein PHLGIDRAFT_28072 [Phlebiopsis gigantea 11061_1 CR5-6]
MWVAPVAFALLTGCVLGQQHVLGDNIVSVEATTRSPTWLPHSSTNKAINSRVKSLAQELMQEAAIKGLSIGVVLPDGSVETTALGFRSEHGDVMTTDTLFAIASCSKAFLTGSIGILMDDFAQGRNQTALPSTIHPFDWSTKIKDLFPDYWKLMDPWATDKATLRDILSHQSGLPRHDFSYKPTDKPLDVLRRMQYLRPAFELRQRWHYNNQMYMLGAYLVSTYSGIPYTNYVQDRILNPLNMSSTTFSPDEALETGRRSQSWTGLGRLIPFWMTDDMTDLAAGMGGLVSSVEDLTKWIKVLLHGGVEAKTNKTIIPYAAYEEITTSLSIVSGRTSQPYLSPTMYGLAWNQHSYQGHKMLEHSGAFPGFSSEVAFFPDDNVGIVTLANGDEKHKQELSVIYRIIEDYLGLPHKESERLRNETFASNKSIKPALSTGNKTSESLALPLAAYAGHYHDPGYGSFTLCAPSPSPSSECTSVLHDFAPFHDTTNGSIPALYTTVSAVWISHFRLVHRSADVFELHGTFLFPHGYGKDTSPFETNEMGDEPPTAEFWVEDGKVKGVALNGLVGEMTEMQRSGGSLKDTAEVWLEKV